MLNIVEIGWLILVIVLKQKSKDSLRSLEHVSRSRQLDNKVEEIVISIEMFVFFLDCAEYPIFVLVPGILMVMFFSFGIHYLIITTDPVELWASPNSRSRIEKEYYDSHFQPFYRTTQIIIHAKNLSNVYHNTTDGKEASFGPIFNKEFMLKLLELQNRIVYEVY